MRDHRRRIPLILGSALIAMLLIFPATAAAAPHRVIPADVLGSHTWNGDTLRRAIGQRRIPRDPAWAPGLRQRQRCPGASRWLVGPLPPGPLPRCGHASERVDALATRDPASPPAGLAAGLRDHDPAAGGRTATRRGAADAAARLTSDTTSGRRWPGRTNGRHHLGVVRSVSAWVAVSAPPDERDHRVRPSGTTVPRAGPGPGLGSGPACRVGDSVERRWDPARRQRRPRGFGPGSVGEVHLGIP